MQLGHRDIVHIDGGRHAGAADRRRGYGQAMRHHGLAPRARVLPGSDTEPSAAHATQALIDADDLPTAIMAYNDRCAIGILDSLRRHGIDVPGRVSVVGYDDSQLARLTHVDLTTVRPDAARMAELAARAAAERLDDGREQPRDTLLQPQLVIRSSSGPVPAGAPNTATPGNRPL